MKTPLGLIGGVFLSMLVAMFAGENPFHIFMVLAKSSFGSFEDLSFTLFYCTSLIFTGLAVAISFHAGLFNIGAEGQLTIACLVATATSLSINPTSPIAILIPIFAGLLASAGWGMIAGILRAYRGSHEVIVTMMLNFIAAGLTSYLVVGALANPESQAPETAQIPALIFFRSFDPLAELAPNSPFNSSFVVALLAAVGLWVLLRKTVLGFEIQATGENPEAAQRSGTSTRRIQVISMTLAGMLAGGVMLNEIFGSAGKLRLGFSPEYGFVGIAVALLARNNPLAIIPSAFLFGALQKGAIDLDFESQFINRDFARIMQALIILSVLVANSSVFSNIERKLKFWKTP